MADPIDPQAVETVLDSIAEAPAPEAPTPRGQTAAYDFSHPDLLSRDQTRALRTLHEGYAQALAKRLSTELLSNVTAQVSSLEHLTYSEFLTLLPTPTVLSVVQVPELDGKVAIDLNPSLAFSIVDRLLGGPGAQFEAARALTSIEQGLMDRVLRKACGELGEMWRPILELHFELSSIEGNPELARIVSPDEMVVLVSFELAMNDVKGRMNLCMPYIVIEPAIHRLGQRTTSPRAGHGDKHAVREAVGESVRQCSVSVDVDLGHVEVTMRDLLGLEAGDVLRVTPGSAHGAAACVQGVPRLSGVPGRHQGHLAFHVTGIHPPTSGEKGKRA